jgi:hypothetical protein
MKKSKKSNDCSITNFSDILNESGDEDHMASYRQKHFLMPSKNFRMLLVGPSGSGKTNLLLNFLMKFIDYDKLYVYSPHLQQDCYKKLKNVLECVENKIGEEILRMESTLDEMISPEELDSNMQNVFVFDDLVLSSKESQRKMTEMFVRGRHSNTSCFYLSQMYHRIPRDIRLNSTHLCIFDVCNKREMSLLATELNTCMPRDDFINMYGKCTEKPFDFMYIDRENKLFPYRKNLNNYFIKN